jgi:hypothetical protein
MQPLLLFLGKSIGGTPSCFLNWRGAGHKPRKMQSGTQRVMIFVVFSFGTDHIGIEHKSVFYFPVLLATTTDKKYRRCTSLIFVRTFG